MTLSISNLHRRAAKLGWSFHKSAWRLDAPYSRRGYRLVVGSLRAKSYEVLEGADFSLTLEDVARFIEQEEQKRSAS